MVSSEKLIVGLRGSNLSMTQGRLFSDLLRDQFATELRFIKTSGDTKSENFGKESALRDKVDWIKEIEESLVDGKIDAALHSAKDVPVEVDSSTELVPLPDPASRFDVLVSSSKVATLADLPKNASIGTASERRSSQLLALNPEFKIVEVRGNVETRLGYLETKNLDAVVLAEAGLNRLGLSPANTIRLEPPVFIPAINQGILVVQVRKESRELSEFLKNLITPIDWAVFLSERACIRKLGADCKSAVGVFANSLDKSSVELVCRVLSGDGRQVLEARETGSVENPQKLGVLLADDLLKQGAGDLI